MGEESAQTRDGLADFSFGSEWRRPVEAIGWPEMRLPLVDSAQQPWSPSWGSRRRFQKRSLCHFATQQRDGTCKRQEEEHTNDACTGGESAEAHGSKSRARRFQ
mmetsp:Transcript_41262/g.95540  ORF Transcript_41262/g.95540 Transcript_41262/m.95540 type:complete len:104 (+) Transcript_41262:452-763(+)